MSIRRGGTTEQHVIVMLMRRLGERCIVFEPAEFYEACEAYQVVVDVAPDDRVTSIELKPPLITAEYRVKA